MKAQRFFAAPYLLISAFLLVIISGEHLGGFYLLYLLLALPYAGIHALLAVSGILVLVLVHKYLNWTRNGLAKLGGSVLGVALLGASLYSFFYNDKAGYNDSTFEQAVPIATFIIAAVLATAYLIINAFNFLRVLRTRNPLAANGQ